MSRVKKLKLLAKSTKTPYHPTQRDAAAYERVTQFVMQQARMAHEAGFAKGMGLDTAETMRGLVAENEEARRFLRMALNINDDPLATGAQNPGARDECEAFLAKDRARFVPKPPVPTVAFARQIDSHPEAQPPVPTDVASPCPPDAAPADEALAAPPQ